MVAIKTLVADPPWQFSDSGTRGGVRDRYDTLSVEDICDFPLPWLADDCRLFLWRVSAMQEEALRVVAAWGFVLKTELVWLKMTKHGKRHFGAGHTLRASHETCLIATRGRPERLNASTRSVLEARVGEHSAKPEEFYELVQALSPGPYCELFARKRREGWLQCGDQLGTF